MGVWKRRRVVDMLGHYNICPTVVLEILELYISSVRPSRRFRPIVAVVVVLCPSIRPVVRPVVVVRPLSVGPVVSVPSSSSVRSSRRVSVRPVVSVQS